MSPAHPVHGDGPRPPVAHHQGAVHLGVLDRQPGAVDAHAARQVRRRVEPGGQDPVAVGWHQRGVLDGDPVGAVHLELVDQAAQHLVVAGHVDAGTAGVEAGLPDGHVGDLVVAAGVEDAVEDLGQQQRIDDVAGDFDRLAGHASSSSRCPSRRPVSGGLRRQGYHAARHGTADQRRREAELHARRGALRDQPLAHRHGPRALRRSTTCSATGPSTSWPAGCSTRGRHRGPRQRHGHGAPGRRLDGREAPRRDPGPLHLLPARGHRPPGAPPGASAPADGSEPQE